MNSVKWDLGGALLCLSRRRLSQLLKCPAWDSHQGYIVCKSHALSMRPTHRVIAAEGIPLAWVLSDSTDSSSPFLCSPHGETLQLTVGPSVECSARPLRGTQHYILTKAPLLRASHHFQLVNQVPDSNRISRSSPPSIWGMPTAHLCSPLPTHMPSVLPLFWCSHHL